MPPNGRGRLCYETAQCYIPVADVRRGGRGREWRGEAMTVHDPIFRIGVVAVHPFGLFVAMGIVLGYVGALWCVPRAGLPARYLPGMLIVVVLGSLVTARLAFVALHPDTVRD